MPVEVCGGARENWGLRANKDLGLRQLEDAKHPSKVFLVLFLQKKNGTLKLSRAPRLKREIVKTRLRVLTRFPKAREQRTARKKSVARPLKEGFRSFCDSKIEMKSQRATGMWRSGSGAAVRPTRGGKLGRALVFACSSGGGLG
ncbi:hypothetical protein [uncultured Rikenella sp.]|uniref:hypothetical protein n=1 Tax=uncultured Rikenella sp. TaxID=368003 RepID=UPI00261666B3|nr:hypothetical protein [uncultured Rikenella sp.]